MWFHFHILSGKVSSSENDHSSGTYKVVAHMSRAMTRIETNLIVKIWNSRHGAMSPSRGYTVSAHSDRFTLEGATTAEVPAPLTEALKLVVDEVNEQTDRHFLLAEQTPGRESEESRRHRWHNDETVSARDLDEDVAENDFDLDHGDVYQRRNVARDEDGLSFAFEARFVWA